MTGAAGRQLDDARLARYARQLLVPGFGEEAQQRLAAARVRAFGAGAVSSAALVYLVQAGVGGIWLEDPEVVGPQDAAGWLHGEGAVGRPRVEVAAAALRALSRYVTVEPYPTGGIPTAALVATNPGAATFHGAESARRMGVPHAVVDPDADGGAVVSVPPGAPCYACARSTSSPGRPPLAGAAALSALAAQELVQMVALPGSIAGRRIDLLRGVASVRPTVRLAGCACAKPVAPRAG